MAPNPSEPQWEEEDDDGVLVEEIAEGQAEELSRFRIQPVHEQCPYCWTSIDLVVDCSVDRQHYIEDCPVCCRPIELSVQVDGSEPHLHLSREDE